MATYCCAFAPTSGVAKLRHWYDAPAEAVRVTLPPVQKVVGPLGVIVADGGVQVVIVAAGESSEVPSAMRRAGGVGVAGGGGYELVADGRRERWRR